jgi:tetratricopeptide (TPR) repeat protein
MRHGPRLGCDHLIVLVLITAFCIGCSRPYSTDLLRAEQAERDGSNAAALKIYESVLPRIPAGETRTRGFVQMRMGACLLQIGKPNEAFLSFQQAVASDSQNLEAHRRVAEMLLLGGATQKAAEELNAILQKRPDDAAAIGTLGAVHASVGNVQSAVPLLERSFRLNSTDSQVAITLAELYNRLDRTSEARTVLVQSASRNGNSETWLALGRLEEQEGKPDAAESAYRSAVKASDSVAANLRLAQFLQRAARIDEATKILQRVDSMRRESPPTLGDFYLYTGRPVAAAQIYSQEVLSRAQPNTELLSRYIEARIATQRPDEDNDSLERYSSHLDAVAVTVLSAELALKQGNLPLAEVHGESLSALAPESASALYIRGSVLRRSGKRAEAKSAWNAALEIDPKHIPTRLLLAFENLNEGDLPSAEEHAAEVVREEPANIQALLLYARSLAAQKKWQSSEAIARRALIVHPQEPTAHAILGVSLLNQKDYASALTEFERALIYDSESLDALNGLLDLYSRGHITYRTIRKMEAVAAAPPSSAPLLEVAGRLYAAKRHGTDAVRALRRSLAIEPRRSSAALKLAQLYSEQGDFDSARKFSGIALGIKAPGMKALLEARDSENRGDYESAIKLYENAVRTGEPTGAAANNLAWIYADRATNLERAQELAQRATELDSTNPATWDTLGYVQLRRRDFSGAIATLTSAATLVEKKSTSPATREAFYTHLAQAYANAGLPEQAESVRRKTLK